MDKIINLFTNAITYHRLSLNGIEVKQLDEIYQVTISGGE